MQNIFCQEKDQILSTTKEIYYDITHVRKNYHHFMYLEAKDATKESAYSTKTKYILLTHFLDMCVKKVSHNFSLDAHITAQKISELLLEIQI